jgi:hypothetical protein
MRKRIVVAVGVSVCLFAIVSGAIPSLGATHGSVRSSSGYPARRMSTKNEPWNSICSGGDCVISDFGPPTLTTRPDVSHVDVTLTVTLDLSTSRGDWGAFSASFSSEAATGSLPPGTLRVMSPSPKALTTTTLVWAISRLPARGRTYLLDMSAYAIDGNGDGYANIVGRHLTLIAEQSES